MKKLVFLLQISLVLSIATPFITNARDLAWTGAASGNWNDSANFSPMYVPNANDTVTIDAASNHPRLTTNASVYRLVLLDDTFDLNGYQLNIANEAIFSGGWLVDGSLECRGTIVTFAGTVINAAVDVDCTTLELNGSVFNQSCYFKAETGDSQGGNTFMVPVLLVHVGTAGESITMALENGDTFHDSLYVSNNSDGNIHLTQTDTSYFKNCVRLASTGTGSIHFGREGGISILETNGHLVVENGEFTAGQLFIKNIEQQNATGHRMVLTGTGSSDEHSLLALESCHFSGNVDFTAPNLLLTLNRFNGEALFTKTGGYDNVSTGDNLFSQNASFTNSSTTGHLLLTGSREDRFLGTAQFTSGTMRVILGYGATAIFEGDVVVNASTVGFYRMKFTGEAEQTLSGTAGHLYGETELDKASGSVTATIPIAIDRRLTFTKGYLVTDSVNLITFLAGATASGATDSSFVSGPVKKVGNTAFEFPVGKGGHFRPVGISAPDSVTDAFVGEYFAQGHGLGSNMDSTITDLSQCSYWKLNEAAGGFNDTVSLAIDSTDCDYKMNRPVHIAYWNGIKWVDTGVSVESPGKVMSPSAIAGSRIYTIAHAPLVVVISPNASPHTSDFFGYNGSNIIRKSGLESSNFLNNLQNGSRLYPGAIRYPGGTTSNWWNWKTGSFFDESLIPETTLLPVSFMNAATNNPTIDNRLQQYKPYLDHLGAKSFLTLNMLTSDIPYQAALIAETHRINIPGLQVELGNEFYLDDRAYINKFASGIDYTAVAEDWAMNLKNIIGPDLEVGIVGATTRNSDPDFKRRSQWLDQVIAGLTGMGAHHIDAVTLHDYFGSGIGSDPFPQTTSALAKGTYNLLFGSLFSRWSQLVQPLGQIGKIKTQLPTLDIWISEFNLFDGDENHRLHGTWAHGLMAATKLLMYLEEPAINKVILHTIVGNAVFSALFNDTDGFSDMGEFAPPLSGQPSTQSWEFTAVGNAVAPLAKTLRNTTSHQPLIFPGSPLLEPLAEVIPGIYGWLFEGPESYEAIIMRLDYPSSWVPAPTINISAIQTLSGSTGYTQEKWYQAGADYLNSPQLLGEGIIGNADGSGGTNKIKHEVQLNQASSLVQLNAYSITKLIFPKNVQECTMVVSDAEICDGESIMVLVTGAGIGSYGITLTNASGCTCTLSNQQSLHDDEVTATISCTNASTTTPGTIEIVSNASNTCSSVLTVYPALPQVSIVASPAPAGNFYPTGTLTLAANVPGGGVDYYIWIGDHDATGIIDPYAGQTDVNVEKTSEFTLYYSNNLNNRQCWGRATLNLPVCSADGGPDRKICGNQSNDDVLIGTPAVTGLNYSWTPSNDLDDDEIAQPTASPPVTTTYTVTVSDGNGCSSSSQVTVNVLTDCCTGAAGDYVSRGESTMEDLKVFFETYYNTSINCNSSGTKCTLNLPPSVAEIYINGDLTINEPDDPQMTFMNCNIHFSPNAKVSASFPNKDLTLQSCTLNRCFSGMWDGIYMSNPANELTVTNSNSVDGCQHCLSVSRGAALTVTDNQFTHFWEALRVENYDGAVKATITGNTFSGTGNLTVPFAGQGSLCGIWLEKVADIKIGKGYNNGGTAISVNTFEYSKFGIYSNQSNAVIENNRFQYIYQPWSVTVPLRMSQAMQTANVQSGASVAILAISDPILNPMVWPVNKVSIGSTTTDYSYNTFSYCEKGIEIGAISASIINNQMNDCRTGMYIHDCRYKEIEVKGNEILDVDFGISMYQNQHLSDGSTLFGNWIHSRVNDNTIRVNSPWVCNAITGFCTPSNAFGISDVGNGIDYSMPDISNNTIETRGRFGMLLQNTMSSLLKNNSITMLQGNIPYLPGDFYGIRAENAFGARIGCNSITGSGTNWMTKKIALSGAGSPNLTIESNQTHYTRIGLQFLGNCDNSTIQGNEMNHHDYGFYVGSDATGTGGVIGPQTLNGDHQSRGNKYQGDNNTGVFPGGYATYTFNSPPPVPFWTETNITGVYYTPQSNGSNIGGNEIATSGPIGSIGIFDASGTNDCIGLRVFDWGTTIGWIEVAEQVALDTLSGENHMTDALLWSRKLNLYKDLNRNPTLIDSSVVLEIFYDDVSNGNIGKFAEIDEIIAQVNEQSGVIQVQERAIELTEQALEINQSIQSTLTVELNRKTIHEVILASTVLGVPIDSIWYDDIEFVAFQCPYVGGDAVFLARSLYRTINDTVMFYDSLLCAEPLSERILNSNLTHSEKYDISVYPNPNSGTFTVTYFGNGFENIMFELFDITNRLLMVKQLSSTSNYEHIDTGNIRDGIYGYRLTVNNEMKKSGHIIIVR